MGGGDLNLKKSWHPTLLRNQERVWAEEKRALEERKRIDQLRRERDEERQIQELQRLQEESGQQRRQNRVDWMYQAPSGAGAGGLAAGAGTSEEMEGYLLGKRRIDGILLKRDEESLRVKEGAVGLEMVQRQQKEAGPEIVTSGRDMMSKINADPLLEIKKREQSAWEDAVKESVRREDRERKRREREHYHRYRSKSRSRSMSPEKGRKRESRSDPDHHRDQHHRHRHRHHHHHGSSRHDRGGTYDNKSYRDRHSSYHYRRLQSPLPDRERRRGYHGDRDDLGRNRARDRDPIIHNPNQDRSQRASANANLEAGDNRYRDLDRQRKLAEMQAAAQDMEDTRRKRIADVTSAEECQRAEEDRQRSDRGRFVGQLHQQVQSGTLDDRLRRERGRLAIDAD